MKKLKGFIGTIKSRILLLVIIPLVLMAIIQGNMMLSSMSKELKRQVDASNLVLAESGASLLFEGLNTASITLESLAKTAQVQNLEVSALQNAGKSASSSFKNFESVVFFNNQGRLVAIEPNVPGMQGKDFSQGDYFKEVATNKKAFICEPIPSEATGNLVVTVSVPILKGDTFVGVAMGSVNVEGLQKLLFKNKLVGEGYYFAVNKQGKIFVHPDPNVAKNLTDATSYPAIKKVMAGEKGNDTAVWQGDTQLLGFAPVPETGWGVVTVQFEKDLYAPFEKLKNNVVGFSTVIILIVALIAGLFAFRTTRPLGFLAERLKDIAQGEGDLTARLTINSKDELGEISHWFNIFVEKIQQVIRQVGNAAEEVASTSGQLSGSTEQSAGITQQITSAVNELAEGSGKQTHMINNTVQSVQQLAESVNHIAAGANEQASNVNITTQKINAIAEGARELTIRTENLSKSSTENYKVAHQGGEAVNKSIESMKRIQDAVLDSSQKISQLGEQSKQIGEIIQVIDDIAEQTNLLALNAAIEAARAGEHGKGFAVVADEVRKLAERSGKATKEIADLITGIQRDTSASVKSMEIGTIEVKQGVDIVREAGSALEEIVTIVKKTNSELDEVLQSICEISESAQDVSKAAQNVAAITEENTAATEQMAASSEQTAGTVTSIAGIAEQNASIAEELSASVEEVNAATEEIAVSAQVLFNMSNELKLLVNQFRV